MGAGFFSGTSAISAIGGQDHRRDAGRVFDGAASDLGRVDDLWFSKKTTQ